MKERIWVAVILCLGFYGAVTLALANELGPIGTIIVSLFGFFAGLVMGALAWLASEIAILALWFILRRAK